ncbi:MAG: hypothetical protein JWP61_2130 [Friedmanniella sp.]|nr:hypothetical protein [Friedmanniella sp.]
MGFLGKLFGRAETDDDGEDAPITLDVDTRKTQLMRLEQGLDALSREMRAVKSVDNPGWRSRVNEYSRLAGEASVARRGIPTREGVLDLVFEIRPVFTGPAPAGLGSLEPLQAEVLAAAEELRTLQPGERG